MENQIQKQRSQISTMLLSFMGAFLKVKFGSTITDGRGSIAGVTYSRNHYGPFIRARVTPINPNSTRQQVVRASIAFLAARWAGTLTLAQRTAWDLYGSSVAMTDSLGATMYLTGYNQYIRSNLINKMTGNVVIDDGPVIFEIPAHDPTMAITASEATQQISTTYDVAMDWAVEDGGLMFLFQGKPQNAQRSSFDGPWRYIDTIVGIDPGGPASPRLTGVDFAIAEGQHQWTYARILRADGRLSQPFRADTFCAA